MRNLFFLITLIIASASFAGVTDTTLFTYGEKEVKVSEFRLIYEKNNLNREGAYTYKSLEEYLDLYVNFKLKVQDALDKGYDTVPKIAKEIKKYKEQLAKSYLNEKEINSNIIEEAYERLKTEVNASHILINVPANATPEDTLAAFKKITGLRTKIKKGADFAKMAKEHSTDPSAKSNGGNLGYFTALQMVYPFESHAYKTNVGELSNVFRTRFGYHILKVHDKRESRGKIKVAHLFLKVPKDANEAQVKNIKDRIDTLHAKIVNGASFERMVQEFSNDKASSKKGGVLRKFGSGEMVKEFEDAAFALEKNGAISAPVQTNYGFHVIKRINHEPLGSFEELESMLKKRVAKDSRSNVAERAMLAKIKVDHKYKGYAKNLEKFKTSIDSTILVGKWNGKTSLDPSTKLFKLDGRTFTLSDFKKFMKTSRKIKKGKDIDRVVNYYYSNFEKNICMNTAKGKLPAKYPEFKALLKEYNDGILLFEITDDKVWKKAVDDTTGLEAFYKNQIAHYFPPKAEDSAGYAHFKKHYLWNQRVASSLFYCKNEATIEMVRRAVEKGDLDESALLEKLNKKDEFNLKIEKGVFEKGDQRHVDETHWKVGLSDPFKLADGQYLLVYNKEVMPTMPKELKDIKGVVISDYQANLEAEWLATMKSKYPIKIDMEVLKQISK